MSRAFDIRKQPGFATIAIGCFVALYLPIGIVVVFAFNAGDSIAIWEGLSLRWFEEAFNNAQILDVSARSLRIASVAAVCATAAATMAALGTTRSRHSLGLSLRLGVINQPLLVPEIVTAVGLLIFFSGLKVLTGYSGIGYLIAAHIALCIPFAYLPIRARLISMDKSLEMAAADLYAPPWRIFWRVTFPLLWPGILAGLMLAFVISLDNVVITEFVKSGGQDTLPTYILGRLRRIFTPEINAISTVFLMISVSIFTAVFFLTKWKSLK